MYHSDLELEIRFLQAKLSFKRTKLEEYLKNEMEPAETDKLFTEIQEIEHKLQQCFEEQKTQSEKWPTVSGFLFLVSGFSGRS